MGRRRRGDPVHGWLTLDKPSGVTSAQAVATAKRLFNAQKTGHAGTLDPLASGLLPIAFGEATKLSSFAMHGTKTYRFTVAWGAGDRNRRHRRRRGRKLRGATQRRGHSPGAAGFHRNDPANASGLLRHQGRWQARL